MNRNRIDKWRVAPSLTAGEGEEGAAQKGAQHRSAATAADPHLEVLLFGESDNRKR